MKFKAFEDFAAHLEKCAQQESKQAKKRAKRKAQMARKQKAQQKAHVYESLCTESGNVIFAACKGTRTCKKVRAHVTHFERERFTGCIRTGKYTGVVCRITL